MKSKRDHFSCRRLKPACCGSSGTARLRICSTIGFVLLTVAWQPSHGVWSSPAMERLRAQRAGSASNSSEVADRFRYQPAVFYGNRQQRRQNGVCEKLKCEFIATGCLVTEADPPPSFDCFNIWSDMSLPEAGECPYKPCESYNQKSTCVSTQELCTQGQGQLVDFGLCSDNKRCCLFPGKS